ncbi:pyruvate formate lyase-activating protein [Listeria aquatica]|uniref:Pyruvate formate-lyase-activating enzyme n=1 Tax=Listeria aquatica TaxID=1494960 RepID=A0A841ZNZ1_9LIST|nr:pyruvate formate-lyase-activating protein [Listeria aquatica]MBC1520885.1 pyruvate formate lyase-activating protein [Listeria aquatica]
MEKVIGHVHSTETMGTVDGPGVRFIVFLQGCLLRCQFCHNPDTWKIGIGNERTAQEVFNEAIKYKEFWDATGGGITVSGGEPLLQIDFLIELFTLCKEAGVHTTIDSCGGCFTRDPEFIQKLDQLMELTDLILLDIKQMNPEKHLKLTSRPNAPILDFAHYLRDKDQPIWVRHVLIPTKTDDPTDLHALHDFIATLPNVKRVEVLPYHTMGVYKWEKLGIRYPLEGIETPDKETVEMANEILKTKSYL